MKKTSLGMVALLLSALPPLSHAQFAISWSKVAGGGGTSTNGQFTLQGTVGQPDAGGPMNGEPFSLTGGFWVLPGTVEVAGGPMLHVAPAGPNEAMVWWTPATPGWVLQEGSEVSGPWTNAPSGAKNPATVPAVFPRKFYRLYKP